MKKVLASYWFPSLLGVLPTVFWAPSELSFMLIFCFSPLLIWLYRKEKLREIFIGTYLFFLVFDLISLRWLWQVEFSVKGWVIAIIALILLPALQSIPIFLGMALSKRLNLIYVLGSIPVIAVMFDFINAGVFLGFPWLNPVLALGSSLLKPMGAQYVGILGLTFFLYLSNVGAALIYIQANNLQRGAGIALIVISILVTYYPVMTNAEDGERVKVMAAFPEFNPYNWSETELYEHSRHVLEAIELAKKNDVQLVIFPEGYLRDFGSRSLYANVSIWLLVKGLLTEITDHQTSALPFLGTRVV